MPRSVVAVLLLVCATSLSAQTPYLVSDLNTTYVTPAGASYPGKFVAVGAYVYFTAISELAGKELFRTDGSTIELVKDISPGPSWSSPSNVVPLAGDTFVFHACDLAHGCELWMSNGTAEGTTLVKDIVPGSGSSNAKPLGQFDGKAFFVAQAAVGWPFRTWVTDGTAAGTVQLPSVSQAYEFQPFDGAMYFTSDSGLCRSDGTAEGTVVIRSGMMPSRLIVVGGRLIFGGTDFNSYGYELWTSDGTTAGTRIVKDLSPDAGGALQYPVALGRVGSSAVFVASDSLSMSSGLSLWRTDGTTEGTLPVRSFGSLGCGPSKITSAGELAYFYCGGLWRTDGSDGGTFQIKSGVGWDEIAPGPNATYFFARSSNEEFGLWSTDGSVAGTKQVQGGVIPGHANMLWTGGKLYFSGHAGSTEDQPWVSDGTPGGTAPLVEKLATPPTSSNPTNLRDVNGKLFFTASNPSRQVYVTDGTAAGTIDLTGGTSWRTDKYDEFVPWRSELVFTSTSGLWRSDGTTAGTALFVPQPVSQLFGSSRYVYYYFQNADPYRSFFRRTDGTAAGTFDLHLGEVLSMVDMGEKVYFNKRSGIWRSEGTPDTTAPLISLGWDSKPAYSMIASGTALYYGWTDEARGSELWRTDVGSLISTVFDVVAGPGSSEPRNPTAAGELVFFSATSPATGREIWRTDGTDAGTLILRDIEPGVRTSDPTDFAAGRNVLFFTARTAGTGRELWKSDGTAEGTFLVADIAAGSDWSHPDGLVTADGFVWFAADDQVRGRELWKSDGTAAGTQLVADLMPGRGGSWPRSLTVSGRKLYFTAETSAGRELWALDLAATSYVADNARVTEGNEAGSQLRFVIRRQGDVSVEGSVAYATLDGSATAGSDYVARSGTVTFAGGVTEVSIDVDVLGDTVAEGSETFWLTIFSPVNGLIEGTRGRGVIEDDDLTADLSITHVFSDRLYERVFIVRNDGSAAAPDVMVRMSESPTSSVLTSKSDACVADGFGALKCGIGTLAPGQSRTVTIDRYEVSGAYVDSTSKPGFTVIASAWSTTARERDSSNNTVAYLIDATGAIRMPPFLVTGSTMTGTYVTAASSSVPRLVNITSSNSAVTVAPSPVTVAAGERQAAFTVEIGGTSGSTTLSANTAAMRISIVPPGVEPRLDVAMDVKLPSYVEYGEDISIDARVAARRADGTYPTGVVQVLDTAGSVMVERSIDANGRASFVLSPSAPDYYRYRLRYLGDDFFNPLTVSLATVTVKPLPTTFSVEAPDVTCGSTVDVIFIVRTLPPSTLVPRGVVEANSFPAVRGTLVPTGNPREASVALRVPVSAGNYSVRFHYAPESPFASGEHSIGGLSGCATFNLNATATSTSRVELYWTLTGYPTYDVLRNEGNGYVLLAQSSTNAFVDTTVAAGRAYLYRVRPTGIALLSPPDVATTVMFENDPVVAGATPIRAVHFTQLMVATNAIRAVTRLSIASFSVAPSTGQPVRTQEINEVRSLLAAALRMAALPEVVFTDPTLTSGMPIKAVHVQELRNAVK